MRSSKLAVATAWNHIRASPIYLPPQFRPLSSQSPAEPASTAVPASAAKQQNDNYNYEKSGHIHWVSPVGSALRIFTRVRAMHSNYSQRSVSPFRSIDVFLRSIGHEALPSQSRLETHDAPANRRVRSMTEAALRKASVETMVASKSLARRRLRESRAKRRSTTQRLGFTAKPTLSGYLRTISMEMRVADGRPCRVRSRASNLECARACH
jgi:hypothetical protein